MRTDGLRGLCQAKQGHLRNPKRVSQKHRFILSRKKSFSNVLKTPPAPHGKAQGWHLAGTRSFFTENWQAAAPSPTPRPAVAPCAVTGQGCDGTERWPVTRRQRGPPGTGGGASAQRARHGRRGPATPRPRLGLPTTPPPAATSPPGHRPSCLVPMALPDEETCPWVQGRGHPGP